MCPGPGILDTRDKMASKVDMVPDPKGSDSTMEDWQLNKWKIHKVQVQSWELQNMQL